MTEINATSLEKAAAPEPEVRAVEADVRALVESLAGDNAVLQERLTQVTAMFAAEDRGWVSKWAADGEEGMTLAELQDWSIQIRNALVGNPHIKRGCSLRTSFVRQGGIKYRNIPTATQGRSAKKTVDALIKAPLNQRNYFGSAACARRETDLFADGIALYIGKESTKILRNLPLAEVTADYRDPDFSADVWAYRRTWKSWKDGQATEMHRWYYTDTFVDNRTPKILHGGIKEDVDQDHVIFDMVANGVDGFAYGSPDALAAVIWSRIVRDLFMDGKTMTAALATFAFKASVTTKAAGDKATIKLASKNGAGSTAVVGGANDLAPLSSAGKGYDFKSFEPVVAIVAAALDLSVEDLTGTTKTGSDTSSSLALATRLAIARRREEHVDFDLRILRWMGAKDPEAFFSSLMDPTDLYRAQQGVGIKWGTGLYTAKEIKTQFEALEGNDLTEVSVPTGVLVPNTQKTLDANSKSKAAAAPAPAEGGDSGTGGGANPTQGSASTFSPGKGQNSNDINQDR